MIDPYEVAIMDETATKQHSVLMEVWSELDRQLEKWGVQSHTLQEWAGIEAEEFGDACADGNKAYFLHKQICDLNFEIVLAARGNPQMKEELGREWGEKVAKKKAYLDAARQEWIQVAAVAVAIVESMDRQRPAGRM